MSHALTFLALTTLGADKASEPKTCPAPVATSCQARVANAKADEPWRLSLREAIRIALDNAEGVRVLAMANTSGERMVIAPACKGDVWRFKAEVMAQIRSVEQQYWSLAQQHAQLWASEKAVELAEEILKREQSELEVTRGTVADVAEAQQRLEQFRLDLVTKTSDVITTERQLRNLLGLPPADGRRIVPVTAAIEARLTPVWETCLAEALEKQPDVARQKATLRDAERRCEDFESDVALTFLLDLSDLGPLAPSSPELCGRLRSLARERENLQDVTRKTVHSLARFFLEVDANYKQFKTASRFRAAAAQRLEAQRAFYEEGRITVDRYLDAVSQFASAVAQEAQFKAGYNISIITLEEAKGTLLAYDNITVAEGPSPSPVRGKDDGVQAASFEAPTGKGDEPQACKGDTKDCCAAADGCPKGGATGKTVSFQLTVGVGAIPVEIRGSFTVRPAAGPSSDHAEKP
jgi:hypothetical protein